MENTTRTLSASCLRIGALAHKDAGATLACTLRKRGREPEARFAFPEAPRENVDARRRHDSLFKQQQPSALTAMAKSVLRKAMKKRARRRRNKGWIEDEEQDALAL